MPSNRSPGPLTATFVRQIQRPGSYGEGRGGHGLTLRVKPRKAGGVTKHWVQRLRVYGRPVNIGLGPYPLVTLAKAREAAISNRRQAREGYDPRVKAADVPTFGEAAEAVIKLREPTWKSGSSEARIWRSSFRDYVYPTLAHNPVNQISTADILNVLTPIWLERSETARRLRQRISIVLQWCVAQGFRQEDPAGKAIAQALPRAQRVRRNFPALPYSEVAQALGRVKSSGARRATILCFEFLVLTAVRSGEARHARWDQITFQDATWTIPAAQMKTGRVHRVPLSSVCINLLHQARDISDGSGWLFPGTTGATLSSRTLTKLLQNLAIGAVPHGFRASFRTWAEEMTDAPRAVMEAALAHRLGDAAEQAYARSDLFQKRRALMEAWAAYLSTN